MADLTFVLSECLDAIERGELTLEGCLARYPEHRTDLDSLLRTASRLRAAPPLAPSKFFQRSARVRLGRRLSPRTTGASQPKPTQPELAPPNIKPNLIPSNWPIWLSLASVPILIVGLALLLGVGWFAFFRPASTANLTLTLISIDTAVSYDGVYCYASINQQPFERLPNDFDLFPPDSTQPLRYPLNETYEIQQPREASNSLSLSFDCWGRRGVEALPLGLVQATHTAVEWDGTIRTAIADEVFTLRYCLNQSASQCK